jgi:hypothetical protein
VTVSTVLPGAHERLQRSPVLVVRRQEVVTWRAASSMTSADA